MSSNTSSPLSSKPAVLSKIAIIEDEHALREMYKFKLEKEGYTVVLAEDGVTGLALLKEELPDLVLLDLKMPNMSGEEMLAKLRAEKWGAHMRVVVLTNINKSEADQSLRFLGVDRYIVKAHTTPNELVRIIRSVG